MTRGTWATLRSVEVADGCFAVDQSIVEGKNAVILGWRAAIAIDTGNNLADGEAMVAALRALGHGPERLVLTHGHGDHILGGAPFKGAEVYAHAACPAVMRRHMPALVARYGVAPDTLAWPAVTFAGELTIDLGGRIVRLIETPGHSADGISVYVPEERLLVGGDAVVTGIVPAIQDGDSAVLEGSLRRLQQLEIDVLIPGHGPVIHGADAIMSWLTWEAQYLSRVRELVGQALRDGARGEAAIEAAPFDRLVAGRLPADRHGMAKRHRDTVGKIVWEQCMIAQLHREK